jgi:hypothetical protein
VAVSIIICKGERVLVPLCPLETGLSVSSFYPNGMGTFPLFHLMEIAVSERDLKKLKLHLFCHYMFQLSLAIFRQNTQLFSGSYLTTTDPLLCIPPEDGQRGPKHVTAK